VYPYWLRMSGIDTPIRRFAVTSVHSLAAIRDRVRRLLDRCEAGKWREARRCHQALQSSDPARVIAVHKPRKISWPSAREVRSPDQHLVKDRTLPGLKPGCSPAEQVAEKLGFVSGHDFVRAVNDRKYVGL
jgi:hypothetical protein